MTAARIDLEILDHAHAAGLFVALDDPTVGRFIGGPDVTTIAVLHDRIDHLHAGPQPDRPDERWLNFAVRRRADDVVLGRVEATVHGSWAEIAYVLGPAHQGHGYATEAVSVLIDHLHFDGVVDLWAAVHPDNHASARLLRCLGFTEVAPSDRRLASSDDGDRTFRLRLRADPVAARPGPGRVGSRSSSGGPGRDR